MPLINPASLQKDLSDIDQRKVAVALSEIFIDQLKNPEIQKPLRDIRDIIWEKPDTNALQNYDRDNKRRQQSIQRIDALVAEVPESSRKDLADAYARLGHLYEIAGHAARENFFRQRQKKLEQNKDTVPPKDLMAPGGVHELLFYNDQFTAKNPTAADVVKALSQPISEYVFTQHPTNTNTLESMKLQRELADALDKVTGKDGWIKKDDDDWLPALKESIAAYAKAQVVQEDKNFTVYDETKIVINFLANAYRDIDRLYDVFDRGLSRKFGAEYNDEQRWALDLKQRFSSWGSAGDKDGNNNVKSENTLEAIILHKKEAAELLLQDLNKTQALPEWKEKLQIAKEEYASLAGMITKERKDNDIPLTNDEFNAVSQLAQEQSQKLGPVRKFLDDVKSAAAQAGDEDKEKLRSIHRKARMFGFNLGKIEYRETAEEYSRVVKVLMDYADSKEEYRKFISEFRNKKDLNIQAEMLRNKDSQLTWGKIASSFMNEMKGEELRKYVKADDTSASAEEKAQGDKVIAYHTLRRMQLARDFGEMITHNVLAECKGTRNLIEALALQVATTVELPEEKGTKRAMLHIVPLFEEAETMKQIPSVLKRGLENEAYNLHLEALQEKEDTPNLVQQVQIAHSDNARRAGAIASRGIIHDGHHEARKAITEYNADPQHAKVELQFFEGGSQSDSYRNGVRAVTAAIKDFGLGEFAKMTFQGGDLLNYFNEPTSSERLMLRSIVEQTKLMNNGQIINGKKESLVEKVIAATLESRQKHYDLRYYPKENGSELHKSANPIGKLLHALDYRKQTKAGSAGTRGNRKEVDYSGENITGVPVNDARTIGVSECFQHGGLHPSCLGTQALENDLSASLFAHEEAREEIKKGFSAFKDAESKKQSENGKKITPDTQPFDDKGQLTAAGLYYLYKTSPTFSDAIDKMTYSLINTRVYPLTEKLMRYQQSQDKRDDTLDHTYKDVLQEYKDAGYLAYKALTAREITSEQHWRIDHDNNPINALDRTIAMLKETDELRHFEPLSYKHRFIDGLDIIERTAGLENSRLMHNARDTVYHGRTFTADDPNYRNALIDAGHFKRAETGYTLAV